MGENKNYSRRDFLKTIGLATAITAVSKSIFPAQSEAKNLINNNKILNGICDIHIHAAPDTKNRLTNELEFTKHAKDAGYDSIMFKSNDWSCHDRVYLIRQVIPNFEVYGSLCMNDVIGDRVNPIAVKKALQTTGNYCKCIWMPTQNASYQVKTFKQQSIAIPVVDEYEHVLPEVIKVMEICRDADIIFATGHCSPKESLILAKKAQEIGVNKFVVTHANSSIWKMTHDQIKQAIDLGAYIEYSYITNLWGKGTGLPNFTRMSNEEFSNFAKINPQRSFITTDLGQTGMPNPIDGMAKCIDALIENGLNQKDIDLLVKENPKKLII